MIYVYMTKKTTSSAFQAPKNLYFLHLQLYSQGADPLRAHDSSVESDKPWGFPWGFQLKKTLVV